MDTSRFDYNFDQTEKLEHLKRLIVSNFEMSGYRQIHLSAFESTETFVEQKGENVRQKMFTLNGDAKTELCLRPELTVPACKFFLRSLAGKMDYCRMCYEGLVWRTDPNAPGFFGEFTQAGIELIGNHSEVGADAEVMALAIDTLQKCEIGITSVVVNDVRILKSVFEHLEIGKKLQSTIHQALIRRGNLDVLSGNHTSSDESNGIFDEMLGLAGPEKLSEFVVEILASQGNSTGTSSRSSDEVAKRFIQKRTGGNTSLTEKQLLILQELLGISGEVQEVTERLKVFVAKHGIQSIEEYIDSLSLKAKILSSSFPEVSSPQILWDLSFQRSFKFYSGMIFDINSRSGAVCGGGRYDELFGQLGSSGKPIKAAGFAIGVDRLLNEIQLESLPGSRNRKAIVASLGATTFEHCFAVANRVRRSNWIAETDFSGANIKNIIARAVKGDADVLILIGENEINTSTATVKMLAKKTQETISISEIESYLARAADSIGGA